ncbi:pilus assembly protein [Chiayiivirga flava]|uniref:pilus assembly protein n=1 Tax=Chiayiivirga flava TaxID=659595 RepID=UPI001C85F5AA
MKIAVLAALSVTGAFDRALALNIAQTPLFLGLDVKPNFILAVDDSGSMGEQRIFPGANSPYIAWNEDNASFFLAPEQLYYLESMNLPDPAPPFGAYGSIHGDGSANDGGSNYIFLSPSIPPFDDFGFARSPDFNKLYFNPAVTYQPWRKHDGTRWPDADPSAARADPRLGTPYKIGYASVFDFVDQDGRREDGDRGFYLLAGMKVPAGTVYRTDSNAIADCGESASLPGTNGAWATLDQDTVIQSACTANLQRFPAVFFLKDPASLPPEFGYVADPVHIPDALGPGGVGLYKYEIRPENFSSKPAYNAAVQNFANWFQYHGNKILALVASMTEAFFDVRDVRVGQFAINHLQDVKMYDLSVDLDRIAFFDQITALTTSAILYGGSINTPNRSGVNHLGEQFLRTDSQAPIQAACQLNTGMLFTDGYTSKGDGPVLFGNADGSLDAPLSDGYADTMADIVTAYFEGARVPLRADLPTGKVPVVASCEDSPEPWADCERDLHMRFHAVAFGPTGHVYGVDAQKTEEPFVHHPDWNALGAPKASNGPVVVDELWHATLNGRGSFVSAARPSDVTDALKNALKLSSVGTSFSGGLSGSSTRRDLDFLGYVPRYNAEDWTGDLTAHSTKDDGQFDAQVWSAAEQLEDVDVDDRKIYFSDPKTKTLHPFSVDALGGDAAAITRMGLPADPPYGRTVEEIVDYLRGDHTFEQKNPGGTLRNRSSRIGDIFGSQPEVLTSAGFGYTGLPDSEGGGFGPGSYGEFMQTTKKNRTPVAFVGANDGMLHAFDATGGANGGKELFAIIPEAVMSNLGVLPDPTYKHRYFVDGSPVQGDAYDGNAWKTVLLVPMGAGGKSIMALDVTDPAASFGPQNFLWEFTDPGLNETLGKPHVVLLENGKWAAVFGSGIDGVPDPGTVETHAYIYFVDLFSGELIAKVLAQMPYGDDGILDDGFVNLVPVDADYDLRADTVYAADYDGYLWRLDIDDVDPIALGNGGAPLFRAVNKLGRPQIVTGGIDAFPHHIRGQMVFFGSGRYLKTNTDIAPTVTEESFYGIWDDPEQPGFIDRNDLQSRAILSQENVQGVETRRISDAPVDWSTQRGWALDFLIDGQPLTGEKFIGHPVVALGRVMFATYQPLSDDPCSGGGTNRFYSLSATSGVGELALPGGDGTYGAIDIPSASAGRGPIQQPGVITSPPPPACVPGSPGCPLPEPDEQGQVLSAPSPGCRTNLGVLLGDGLLVFDRLTCGRQSWQQLQ